MDRSLLEINNSLTTVNLQSNALIRELSYKLSYPDKTAQFAYTRRTKKFKEFRVHLMKMTDDGNYVFPTGLLNIAKDFLAVKDVPVEIIDNRVPPTDSKYKYYRRFSEEPALRKYQDKCLANSRIYPRGIVEAATGTGKTRMMQEITGDKGLPTLIIVPSLNILKQTYNEFSSLYSPSKVGMVGGGKDQDQYPIIIATFQSLLEKSLSFYKKFDMVLIDESHHAAAQTIQQINEKFLDHVYYRYYFSATPFRNDGADLALEGVISNDKILVYDFKKACKDGYLTPPFFLIYKYDHNVTFEKKPDYRKEYKHLIAENEAYNDFIASVTETMRKKDRQILIFVKQISQGELLREKIPRSVLLTGKEKINDSEDILKAFENKEFDVLIGTSVIGEGVNLKSVDCGIMAGAGKSKGDIIQKIGRLLRIHPNKKNVLVVDFTHGGSIFNRNHHITRKKVYEGYGTKIFTL